MISGAMSEQLLSGLLSREESVLRSLIRRIKAAVVVHRADTRIVMCNTTAQELLGLSEAQMLGKTALDPNWKFFREDGTVLPYEEYPVNAVLASQRSLESLVVGVFRPTTGDTVWVLVNSAEGRLLVNPENGRLVRDAVPSGWAAAITLPACGDRGAQFCYREESFRELLN